MERKTWALASPAIAAVIAFALAACSSSGDDSLSHDDQVAPQPPGTAPSGSNDITDQQIEILPDPLVGLPRGADQLAKLCARGQNDKLTQALCGNGASITSVEDLQKALGLQFRDHSDKAQNGGNGNPAFAMLGHSMSLVTRQVSAINPRAFVFSPPPGRPVRIPGFVVMGFVRGEPFVEVVAEDANARKLDFYLVKFDLECETPGPCKPGDLLTPAVEKNWKGISVYGDEDLKNSIADCRQCHQPNGPGSQTMLRMQELQDPWTHWFRNDRPGGTTLIQDFLQTHGDKEDYFGIPASVIQSADGRAMEDFVTGQGFGNQPNAFDSKQIEEEVTSSSSAQPIVNMPKGASSTWQSLYDAAASGQFIPVPYHDVKVTDPSKLAFAKTAYQGFLAGGPAADLPDIRRVFLESALEEMSMRPRSTGTGKEILVQACAQCHNPKLDQTITRAHFDVTQLDSMSTSQKQNAIARMKLAATDVKHMPPAMFRTLPDAALKLAIDELSK